MRTHARLLDHLRSQELIWFIAQVGDALLDHDGRLYAILGKEKHGASEWLVLGNEAADDDESKNGTLEVVVSAPSQFKVICGGGWELAPTLLAARGAKAS